MKRVRWIIGGLAVAAVATFLIGRAWPGSGREQGRILVSGNIEVTDVELSFKIPGRIDQRLVDEGEWVKKDAVVALLESTDLAAELALRQAELRAAQSHLAELEAGARPAEIEAAKARLDSARADFDRARRDFTSGQKLLETAVISDDEFVHRKGLYDAAAARVREAEEQLKLVQEGPRREQIEQARARVAQGVAAVDLAKTRLGYTKLLAPLSGVVLSKNAEPGEYVAPGTPVVTVGELEKTWLRAYINETDLGRIKIGQRVEVRTDTYPDQRYDGTLSFIASQAEFTPKNVQTAKERVKLVYRIKVDIPNPRRELKPGMPADAEIILADGSNRHGRH